MLITGQPSFFVCLFISIKIAGSHTKATRHKLSLTLHQALVNCLTFNVLLLSVLSLKSLVHQINLFLAIISRTQVS